MTMPCRLLLLPMIVLFALVATTTSAQAQGSIGDFLKNALKKATQPVTQKAQPGSVRHIDAPANDNFADREKLSGTDARVTTDIRGATAEASEPMHEPGQRSHGTVWWTWTAPATGRVTMDTLGGVGDAYQTDFAVYIGDSLNTLLRVARHWAATDGYTFSFPVAAGQTYQIVANTVDNGYGNYIGPNGKVGFNLHFAPTDQPPPVIGRDAFADRALLKGSVALAQADIYSGSSETDEPMHEPGERNQNTLWWTWTAPATGRLLFDTLGGVSSALQTDLVVYQGDALARLLPVARHWADTSGYTFPLPVAAGQTYQIVLNAPANGYGNYTGAEGRVGCNLHFTQNSLPPPVIGRDAFADRATLVGRTALAIADTCYATSEYGEPVHLPGTQDAHTVWWTWTAPDTGQATLDTIGIGGEAANASYTVYVGDALDSLVPMVRSRGIREGDNLTFPVAAGQTYQIVSNGANGEVGFNLHFARNALPAPVVGRDNFADRAVIKTAPALAVANNELATIESGEPDHTPNQRNAHTVWWTWTAPANGTVGIDTIKSGGSTQTTALAVYTGDTLDGLAPVEKKTANTDGYTLGFPVKAGTAYQFAANGYDGGCTGQVAFNLHFHPAMPKEDAPTPRKAPVKAARKKPV